MSESSGFCRSSSHVDVDVDVERGGGDVVR